MKHIYYIHMYFLSSLKFLNNNNTIDMRTIEIQPLHICMLTNNIIKSFEWCNFNEIATVILNRAQFSAGRF